MFRTDIQKCLKSIRIHPSALQAGWQLPAKRQHCPSAYKECICYSAVIRTESNNHSSSSNNHSNVAGWCVCTWKSQMPLQCHYIWGRTAAVTFMASRAVESQPSSCSSAHGQLCAVPSLYGKAFRRRLTQTFSVSALWSFFHQLHSPHKNESMDICICLHEF